MFYVQSNCRFVSGAKGAAIYSLSERKVFALNEIGKGIVIKALQGMPLFTETEKHFLQKLLDMELLTSEPVPLYDDEIIQPQIKFAWLELTNACNLRCVHCYGCFGYNPTFASKVISTENWIFVMDLLSEMGCKEIQLIGGEPILYPGFLQLLQYAGKSFDRVDIFTNATLLNDKILSTVKKMHANIRVSLYGHISEIHDQITQKQGSFKKTIAALRKLNQYNIDTTIAVILMKENEDYIAEIKKLIESLGHRYSGYDTIRVNGFEPQRAHLLKNVVNLKPRYNTYPDFSTSYISYLKNSQWNNCWFGKLAITATGDVLPCIFDRTNVMGNIFVDKIEFIQQNLLEQWRITKDFVEGCKDCEFRYACHDCRPLSKGVFGNQLCKYPRCCYNPYTGNWLPIEEVTQEISQ